MRGGLVISPLSLVSKRPAARFEVSPVEATVHPVGRIAELRVAALSVGQMTPPSDPKQANGAAPTGVGP